MRAVDYLVSRPEVDPQRINITGSSGGGFQTAHIAALDTRINVAAPSTYITALPMRIYNRIFRDPDSDPEQDLFGMMSNGVDHPGLLLMMYPRPVFVAAAILDFFPIEGTHQTVREVADLSGQALRSAAQHSGAERRPALMAKRIRPTPGEPFHDRSRPCSAPEARPERDPHGEQAVSQSMPLATREIGNQSATKNRTGSVNVFATMTPHVLGSASKSRQRSNEWPTGSESARSTASIRRSAFEMR